MPTLKMQDVRKVFGSGHTMVEALKKTNFSAESGELIVVVGPSGSGKSTFLTTAGGLQTPSHGEVTINGNNITQMKEKKRSNIRLHEIGFILQASNLVPFLTVDEQMELLDKVKTNNLSGDELQDLYQSLGIGQLRDKYPSELSGGEQQRVAIAKGLYSDPSFLLADEPTASLDTDRAFEVMKMLQDLTKKRNKTTIVVTHDTRLLDYCDKVYAIIDGEIRLQQQGAVNLS
ncbi:ABC transporter ATP-binding protein [Lentibacillus amyloliquefaciens]|uniref:Putative hemin import ATP-binding protein HrtA n=1 Tax=Lentibacillus amyloliquefaciens TaxID=1472767 RepID=A0A0U4F832_9BACI|nr:ABC transporter ATP-binding protein [Lentibacillus amyloliquefaciens]ALX49766.1 hemin ABC transporter ATP-binding protein [Lentibacillus amyloliquefaciens]